jgi:hypothetical protein
MLNLYDLFHPEEVRRRLELVEKARSYIGFTARALKANGFSEKTGYPGGPWAGAFLETVLREFGLPQVGRASLASSSAAMKAYGKKLYRTPRIGDLVFFAFSQDSEFGEPHIGIVSENRDFKKLKSFRVIEGQTATGLPRGNQDTNGVYERTRYLTDVVGFGRINIGSSKKTQVPADQSAAEVLQVLKPSNIQYGKRSSSTEMLQVALAQVTDGSEFERGVFEDRTRSAFAAYQRYIGRVGRDAHGLPANDHQAVQRLGFETGVFQVKP